MMESLLSIGGAVLGVAGVWVSMERKLSHMDATIKGLCENIAEVKDRLGEMHATLHELQHELHAHDRNIAIIQAKMQNGANHP